MMKKFLLALAFLLCAEKAHAASCSSYPFTLQNNTTADATQVMSNFNTVRNCVINNAAGSGVNTDITSITGLTTPLSNAQGGTATYIGGTSTGSANAQAVATLTPTGWALTTGWRLTFTAGFTNTGATTLAANSGTATAIRKLGQAGLEALSGGEIVAGNIVEAIYNGTFYVLLQTPYNELGPRTSLAGAGTTDIGTIASHNVYISGSGATITALGSTAVATAPVYLISFAGINTLTYNATSLIIPGAANITTAANDTAVVEYLGSGNWQVLSYTRASGAGIVAVTPLPGANALVIANNSGTPNTHIDVTANLATMLNTSNVPISAATVSVTINCTTTGANGLDASSLTTSTWYHVWLISNGVTTAGLASTSATAPTMPSGYTYKVRLGAMQTDGSSLFYRTRQVGNTAYYKVTGATNTAALRQMGVAGAAVGSVTVPTWVAITNSGFVPPTATEISLTLSVGGANVTVIAAPNNAYGAVGSTTNPPFMSVFSSGVGSPAAVSNAWLPIESTSTYWASSGAGGNIAAAGWRDAVNAN